MTVDELWSKYLEEKNLPQDLKYVDSFHFELTKELANALLQLVLDGVKKATASSLHAFELQGEEVPQVGDHCVITDWDGNAKCIIRTSNVLVLPYKDITYDIAKLEGEDDNLESWQKGHSRFFEAEGKELGYTFTEDMPVIFEEFEVVYRIG